MSYKDSFEYYLDLYHTYFSNEPFACICRLKEHLLISPPWKTNLLNKRGPNYFENNVILKSLCDKCKPKNNLWLEELDFFIGNKPFPEKLKKWWKHDRFLLEQYITLWSYLKLFKHAYIASELVRGSRNLYFTNQYTCLSSIYMYLDNPILANDNYYILNVKAFQRSADISLGLPNDFSQVEHVSKLILEKLKELNPEHKFKLKLVYQIGNAHIYHNNIKTEKLIYNSKKE